MDNDGPIVLLGHMVMFKFKCGTPPEARGN